MSDYHTHGSYDSELGDPDMYSDDDMDMNDAENVPGYLGTPSGNILKYIPPLPGRETVHSYYWKEGVLKNLIGILSIMCILTPGLTATPVQMKHSVVREEGFVPNESTAIAIATAVLIPIYGKELIEDELPFSAVLTDGVWTVNGSLKKGYKGGVAIVEISKINGTILRVSHGR